MSKRLSSLSVLCLSLVLLGQGPVQAEDGTGSPARPESSAVEANQPSVFDFAGLQARQYASLAGTWQDGFGQVMFITEEGYIFLHGANGGYARILDTSELAARRLTFRLQSKPDGASSGSLQVLAVGQDLPYPQWSGLGDLTKDRLLLEPATVDARAFFYRISDQLTYDGVTIPRQGYNPDRPLPSSEVGGGSDAAVQQGEEGLETVIESSQAPAGTVSSGTGDVVAPEVQNEEEGIETLTESSQASTSQPGLEEEADQPLSEETGSSEANSSKADGTLEPALEESEVSTSPSSVSQPSSASNTSTAPSTKSSSSPTSTSSSLAPSSSSAQQEPKTSSSQVQSPSSSSRSDKARTSQSSRPSSATKPSGQTSSDSTGRQSQPPTSKPSGRTSVGSTAPGTTPTSRQPLATKPSSPFASGTNSSKSGPASSSQSASSPALSAKPGVAEPKKKGILPKTGEQASLILVGLGLVSLLVALVIKKRQTR